jgi:hypothetical protein
MNQAIVTPQADSPPAELHCYGFDLELSCSLHVQATSHEHALRILRDKLDCADSNLGAWPDGSPILCETSLRGTPALFERDDLECKERPPIIFEPGRAELVRVLEEAMGALDDEEDSVREEHAALIKLMHAMLDSLTDMSRKSELSVFLRLLHRDDDTARDDEIPFKRWLSDLSHNPSAYGHAQALEYLAIR